MAVSRSIWQNIQQYSWLVLALACLIAALVFWAVTDRDALVEVEQPSKTETSVQIQPEKVAATTHFPCGLRFQGPALQRSPKAP